MSHKQPGLDNRHRNNGGEIHRKRGDTLVRTLRDIYGDEFAKGTRSDARLDTLLEKSGATSLDDFLKNK